MVEGKKRRRQRGGSFYGGDFLEEESPRHETDDSGLELIRRQVLEALASGPKDLRSLLRVSDSVARAMVAQQRVSPVSKAELAARLSGVINSLGEQLIRTER